MNFLSCFCCKTKAKAHVSSTFDPSEPGTSEHANDQQSQDQTTELEAIRAQLRLAQRRQTQPHRAPVIDKVVGVVDIPLYESDGHSLKNAGKSYQLFVYDK